MQCRVCFSTGRCTGASSTRHCRFPGGKDARLLSGHVRLKNALVLCMSPWHCACFCLSHSVCLSLVHQFFIVVQKFKGPLDRKKTIRAMEMNPREIKDDRHKAYLTLLEIYAAETTALVPMHCLLFQRIVSTYYLSTRVGTFYGLST